MTDLKTYAHLAEHAARRHHRRHGGGLDDLRQVALMALSATIEKYDPNKGDLGPYVTRRMRQAMGRSVREQDPVVQHEADRPHETDNLVVLDLRRRLAALPSRDQRIVLASVDGTTDSDLAATLGLSYRQIHAIRIRAMAALAR